MRSCGGQVWITGAAKDPKLSVGWMSVVESKKRCKAAEGRSGVTVKEVGGSMEGFNLVDRWQAALEKKRAHNIINGTKSALGFTVLLRGVWA